MDGLAGWANCAIVCPHGTGAIGGKQKDVARPIPDYQALVFTLSRYPRLTIASFSADITSSMYDLSSLTRAWFSPAEVFSITEY